MPWIPSAPRWFWPVRESGLRAAWRYWLQALAAVCLATPLGSSAAEKTSSPAVREITILAAADPAHRSFHGDWQRRAERIVGAASRHFEKPFGLKFRLAKRYEWQYTQAPRTDADAMRKVQEIDPAGCEIVVAFTLHAYDKPPWRGVEARGLAAYFGQYVLIPDQWTEQTASVRLVHELCHVLGAFHVADPRSIMQPAFPQGTPRQVAFGDTVSEVLGLTRNVDFARGVESLDPVAVEKLREMYRSLRHPGEPPGNDPIVAGHRYQLARAEASNSPERVKALRARIVELGGELEPAARPAPVRAPRTAPKRPPATSGSGRWQSPGSGTFFGKLAGRCSHAPAENTYLTPLPRTWQSS